MLMKHVTQVSAPDIESLRCDNCSDSLQINGAPPLWMQLAIKDAFLLAHRDCPDVPQIRPVHEVLIYERAH